MTVAGATRAPPGARTYAVRAFADIADVDSTEWDAILDPDDLQATHRFVSVCQRSGVEGAAYRHVMVYRGERLAAIASFSRMDVKVDLLATGFARAGIRWVRRHRPSFLVVPVAFCGLPVSFGQSCLRFAPGADRAVLLPILSRELDAFGAETEARILCFKEYAPAESVALAPLAAAGYFRAPSLPSCRLTIRWSSFDEYLAAMRAGYRRQVRASLRARAALGLEVRVVEDFGPDCPPIFGLYEQVMDRAEFQLERLNLAFFDELNARLGSQSGAVLLERRGAVAAAAVLLYGPRLVTFLLVGIDYAQNRACHAYPNLVTEVVGEAIRRRAAALEMGQTSYDLKLRFGAVTSGRDIFVKCRRPLSHALLRAVAPALFPVACPPARRVHRAS
ncbi:MAG TPA: peptidogalycan biosysnthesis protein [Gemmatimonadales bacterium]|nr:peptidogalycan biosysnthesis protein [Gemmatimonadales bacterium]HYT83581.1 peptidogalycan biosysnthesis protein [Gemmatimonadales bacterium]